MINSIRNTLIWAFTVIVMVAGFAVISASHAQVAPLSPKRALELTASAAHGYPLHDGQARLYLFADDQCSVCSPALWQATKLPVPVKLVPIKVYVPVSAAWNARRR